MNFGLFGFACLSVLVTGSLYAKPKREPVCPPPVKETCAEVPCTRYPDRGLCSACPAAYNLPASIDTCGSHFFADVSFIYWHVSQNYMDYGRSAAFDPTLATPAPFASIPEQHFQYVPGFKLGLGYTSNYDGWEVDAEYTYLHHESSNHVGSVPASITTGQKIWIPNEWFLNLSTATQQQAVRMDSKWKMHLDFVDVCLNRPFYQGTHLTINPYAGMRALWLHQNFQVKAYLATALTAPPATSNTSSKAWSIGPTFGADMNWLLGRGFRLETDLGFSLLYTRYYHVRHNESFDSALTGTRPISGHMPHTSALRPISQARLGLGWGSYFSRSQYHFDFSASYDFMLLWEQNKPREMVGYFANNETGYSNPIGDLSLHGLTLSGRFDF